MLGALSGASFTSPQQLRQAIDDFIASYNEDAATARHSLLSLLSKWRAGTPALLLERLRPAQSAGQGRFTNRPYPVLRRG